MNVNPTRSTHARSNNPLFDQVVTEIRPVTGRPLAPITTTARYVTRPLTPERLSPEERALVADMGASAARLILQMLHDGPSPERRRRASVLA